MNIFKDAIKITMIITLLFLYSCQKDQNDSSNNTLTKETSEVVTKYKEGDIKLEFADNPDFLKIETSASESLKEKVRQELEKSYSKQTTYLKSGGNTVGVIKAKDVSCGSYQQMYLHMDCEDSGNNSAKSGWIGDCDKNSAGNVILQFCIVNGAYFEATNYDYAVLNLTGASSWPYGVSRISAYIDNENSGNINQCKIDGSLNTGSLGDCWFSYDTRLSFYYYPHVSNSTPFPNLGFTYGVFGQFGNSTDQGYIYSDDEDTNNLSSIIKQDYDYLNYKLSNTIQSMPSGITNIISGVNNTKFWFSKVN